MGPSSLPDGASIREPRCTLPSLHPNPGCGGPGDRREGQAWEHGGEVAGLGGRRRPCSPAGGEEEESGGPLEGPLWLHSGTQIHLMGEPTLRSSVPPSQAGRPQVGHSLLPCQPPLGLPTPQNWFPKCTFPPSPEPPKRRRLQMASPPTGLAVEPDLGARLPSRQSGETPSLPGTAPWGLPTGWGCGTLADGERVSL